MLFEDKIWELVASVPGLALGALIAFWSFKALNRRDDIIQKIASEHHAAYVANQRVVEKNSQVIGECSAELRSSREEIRNSRRARA